MGPAVVLAQSALAQTENTPQETKPKDEIRNAPYINFRTYAPPRSTIDIHAVRTRRDQFFRFCFVFFRLERFRLSSVTTEVVSSREFNKTGLYPEATALCSLTILPQNNSCTAPTNYLAGRSHYPCPSLPSRIPADFDLAAPSPPPPHPHKCPPLQPLPHLPRFPLGGAIPVRSLTRSR